MWSVGLDWGWTGKQVGPQSYLSPTQTAVFRTVVVVFYDSKHTVLAYGLLSVIIIQHNIITEAYFNYIAKI